MRADAVWGLLLAALAAALLVLAYQPREMTIFSQADNMFWPRQVLWPLLGFSLLLAGNALLPRRGHAAPRPASDRVELRPMARPFLVAAGFGGALWLFDVIGFLPTTFLLALLTPFALGRRGYGVVGFAMLLTFVVWVAFLKGLAVPLPRGIGVFRELSLFLY